MAVVIKHQALRAAKQVITSLIKESMAEVLMRIELPMAYLMVVLQVVEVVD
jgi:hypothetical protein